MILVQSITHFFIILYTLFLITHYGNELAYIVNDLNVGVCKIADGRKKIGGGSHQKHGFYHILLIYISKYVYFL